MSANTGIEWTDATWNPTRGCSRVSEGCRNCYAEGVAQRFAGPGLPYEGLVTLDAQSKPKRQWSGDIRLAEKHLLDPLRWREPRRIFVNSMSDLFHPNVPDEWIDRVFGVMALAPRHTFQVLTKRPERMLSYLRQLGTNARIREAAGQMSLHSFVNPSSRRIFERIQAHGDLPVPRFPLLNVWLGVSCENQETANERIPLLLQTPAAVRFISAEPMLGPISFRWSKWNDWHPTNRRLHQSAPVMRDGRLVSGSVDQLDGLRVLDWVIVGGESGPGARSCDVEWVRSLVKQCKDAGVACFVKQLGALPVRTEYGICAGCVDDDELWGRHHECTVQHPERLNLKDAGRICSSSKKGAAVLRRSALILRRPLFLMPMLLVSAAVFYETAYFQRTSWHEDQHRVLRPTADWLPGRVYSPEVEQALAVLAKTDPEKVAFLRSRGIPIHVLTPGQMALTGCSRSSLACTELATSTLNVSARVVNSPKSLAAVLSHELTHCRYHDAAGPVAPASLARRLLWRNEETTAHVAGIMTAYHAGLPAFNGPLAGWWLEFLFWFWPVGTILASAAAFAFVIRVFARESKRQDRRRSRGRLASMVSRPSATHSRHEAA